MTALYFKAPLLSGWNVRLDSGHLYRAGFKGRLKLAPWLLSLPLRTEMLFVFAAHCCAAHSQMLQDARGGDQTWTRVRSESGAEAERVIGRCARITPFAFTDKLACLSFNLVFSRGKHICARRGRVAWPGPGYTRLTSASEEKWKI